MWDFSTIALALAVTALLVWYFWHSATSMIEYIRLLRAWIETRATRQRAAIEREIRFGPVPLWKRIGQVLSLGVLILCAGLLFLR
jgi:hypothetical protein